MTQRFKLRHITDTTVEHTKETFHLVFAVAPAIGAIVSTIIGRELLDLFVEVGLVTLVVLINFGILWLTSQAAKETKELSPFYTFWWNNLLPNRSGDRQTYDVRVLIIENTGESQFREDLQKRFKTEFSVEKLKAVLAKEARLKQPILKEQKLGELVIKVQDPDLYFKSVAPPNGGASDDEAIVTASKRYLDSHLQRPTAVVLVRTDELNKTPSLFKALSDWGYEHSEVPILFAQDENKKFPEDEYAKGFLWIPDDAKALPWSLLQRALTRAKAWRIQATYNRSMVWNILYISLLCIYIGVIWAKQTNKALGIERAQYQQQLQRSSEQRDREVAAEKEDGKLLTQAMDEALSTERRIRPHIDIQSDPTFSVSYWYRIDGEPHILVTTESPRTTQSLKNSYETIIGCTFIKANHLVEGSVRSGENDRMTTVAYSNYQKVPMPECRLGKLEQVAIKNITCVSRDDGSADGSRTVGVCAFTQDEKNGIFNAKIRQQLWDRVRDFHTQFIDRIQNRRDLSLAVREPKKSQVPTVQSQVPAK